ncbi:lysozyme inhibitor LprI family protein [Acinetobacter tianfuensis]|uniref:DUF1311 domain-containing protein n=1 Tax=Acinetobacter tianfuensis TaxID=2419603 RepID=A0A3A8E9N5_9GAMM|nr:lysozyme inhibitor LprI family protein [Acinetobacter tianfuensis]RKG30899.1 DUF1311 domain-containing protein [Acinetobacter tianfuensis]
MKPLIMTLLMCCAGISAQAYALSFSKDYEGCMRKAGSHSESIRTCQIKELKVQNKRLKKVYKLTAKTANPAEQALIKQSKAQWHQQRGNACQTAGKKIKAYNGFNSSCALQMTVSHADMMEVRLNNKIMK